MEVDVKPDSVLQPWQERLDHFVETMREMSRHTDPQEMVRAYGSRMRELRHLDGWVSVSRRDLPAPKYRITRASIWPHEIDPWKQKDQLPLLEGGLLGELLYGERPRIIDDFQVQPDDPAYEYLAGQRSLAAIPHYDNGEALNMFVQLRAEPYGFDPQQFPEDVWTSNLFGRATHNLALSAQLKAANAQLDHELKMVGDLQRSLLPARLPQIPTMNLAVHYQTSRRAGGDYYDFFPLPEGKWGLLMADVSGHGAGAAVIMAITHSIVHSYPGPPTPAGKMLEFVNRKLSERYTADWGTFVTAFYGIYDPATRLLSYSSAGHPPPRLKRCGAWQVQELDGDPRLPLGISEDEDYPERTCQLHPGDNLLLFTDGIPEAHNPAGELFGFQRLDEVMEGCQDADWLIQLVMHALERFAAGRPADDDRTLVVAKIS